MKELLFTTSTERNSKWKSGNLRFKSIVKEDEFDNKSKSLTKLEKLTNKQLV
jgi:hypothetical protein